MTREECKDVLQALWRYKDCGYSENEIRESLEMAIKALEQEPCEDTVSRQEVIDELNRLGRNAFKDDTDYDNFFAFLDSLPSVTPTKCIATVKFSKEDMRELIDEKMKDIVVERKKGHWIMTSDYLTTAYGSVDYVKCSCCGEDSLEEGDYCPNCGCKMSEGGKE